MAAALSALQREALRYVGRATAQGEWARARSAGERVTLASLHRHGFVVRRAWRGTEGEPDAAHEYQLSAGVVAALREKSPRTWAAWASPAGARVLARVKS